MASKPDLGVHVRLIEACFTHPADSVDEDTVGPFDLEIRRGEFISILGPAGCGKNRLLRVIAGLRPLESGSVVVQGGGGAGTNRVGFVFRKAMLFPWRNVLRNVTLEADIGGLGRKEVEQRARRLLAEMSLTGFEDRMPSDLQIEEARRVAICRALLAQPPLLLMDEPFSDLDFSAREHIAADVQRMWMESGFTAVLATGQITEAVQLSDRVVLMSRSPGRILQIIDIDLPRPRRFDKATTPQIAGYASRIRTVFLAQGLPW